MRYMRISIDLEHYIPAWEAVIHGVYAAAAGKRSDRLNEWIGITGTSVEAIEIDYDNNI